MTQPFLSAAMHSCTSAGSPSSRITAIAIRSALLSLFLCLCFPCTRADAHPEGFSGLHFTIDGSRMRAAITLHTRDLGVWFPPRNFPNYIADVTAEMESAVDEIIEVQVDGESLSAAQVKAYLLEVGLIEIDVDFELPATADAVELLIWSKHLIHLPRGHQQLLHVEDRRGIAGDAEHGVIRLEDVLGAERDAAAVLLPATLASHSGPAPDIANPDIANPDIANPDIANPDIANRDIANRDTAKAGSTTRDAAGAAQPDERAGTGGGADTTASKRAPKVGAAGEPSSRIPFFRFGVEHILTGYDHLLFLAALLLACTTMKEAAVIITCFTVAHSITLALAALDIVRIPPSVVEPAIALTIVYVAIENLVRTPTLWHRAVVTGSFGLIHGLGFASVLREIGLADLPGGIVLPLLTFNLGVEAGQLIVAGCGYPAVLIARKRARSGNILMTVGSILIAVIGAYWFVSRIASLFMFGP